MTDEDGEVRELTEEDFLWMVETRDFGGEDSVHAFLYQPQWVTVANKNLKGLWKDMPIFVNDVSALSWS